MSTKYLEKYVFRYVSVPSINKSFVYRWAVSGDFVFGEWLIKSKQHTLLQDYVRLLNGWCEWNNCSSEFTLAFRNYSFTHIKSSLFLAGHFIAAVSFLENGETHKAFDFFMQASKGVLTESFLVKFITPNAEYIDNNESIKQYYLKVIQMFEQHNALDYIIALANTAIVILDQNDSQMVFSATNFQLIYLQLFNYRRQCFNLSSSQTTCNWDITTKPITLLLTIPNPQGAKIACVSWLFVCSNKRDWIC